MRILVTGAAGAIGYHLVRYLSDKGYYVVAVDNYIRGVRDSLYSELISRPNVEEIRMDLTDLSSVCKLPTDIDVIFHLAALNGTQNFYNMPFDVILNSTMPTLYLLNFYKNTGLKRFVYAGSSESYASTVDFFKWTVPTGEDVPLCISNVKNVRWSYAVSKTHGEVSVVSASKQYGMPYTIIRYHNVYGPRMGYEHVIPDFIKRAKRGVYKLFGCHNTRTFIYVEDAVRASLDLALSSIAENEIFNVGGEEEISMYDLGKLILELMGIKNVEIECLPPPEGSVLRRAPNINKLKDSIKFEQKWPLREGLKSTIDYYLKEE